MPVDVAAVGAGAAHWTEMGRYATKTLHAKLTAGAVSGASRVHENDVLLAWVKLLPNPGPRGGFWTTPVAIAKSDAATESRQDRIDAAGVAVAADASTTKTASGRSPLARANNLTQRETS